MSHRIIRICALAAAVIAAANAGAVMAVALSIPHEATQWPASSYSFWPERSWKAIQSRIDSLPESGPLSRGVIGVAHYRQVTLPIYRIHLIPDRPSGLKVLLVSGIHGSEVAGVEALLRIAASMARHPDAYEGADVTMVPVANPWAWVYGYRYDGIGEDVNRDFASDRTQEAAVLRDFMRRTGPYDLFIDLHESKKPGYFLYQYLPARDGLGQQYVEILRSLGRPRENGYSEGPFHARDGLLVIPAITLPWVSMAQRLSLEQYARLHGTRNSYTVETPVGDAMENRVEVQVRTVERFIRALSAEGAAR